jgi:hypothetical protein
MPRLDLSDFLTHFIHRRNPENTFSGFVDDDEGGSYQLPDEFTWDGNGMLKLNEYEEQYYGLESDAYAYGVLKKILSCGYLQSGFSFRNNNATIYGPKAAVCFTEMPLYALINYAKTRNAENFTDDYGIAFLKNELFLAGARSVIYGLSDTHTEAKPGDPNYGIGYRQLASSNGIGLREQYRYVATNLRRERRIDWTHEREWRWADLNERHTFPGMPIFLRNSDFSFSKMIVIVKTDEEAEDILDHLRTLYDSGCDPFGREYNLSTIRQTSVISIESLKEIDKELSTIRLEDIPLKNFREFKEVKVSPATLERVKEALTEIEMMAYNVTEKYLAEHGNAGSAGFCNVITYDAHSEVTQALIKLGVLKAYTNYYLLRVGKSYPTQSLDAIEAGKVAVAKYLSEKLGQSFSTFWEWD